MKRVSPAAVFCLVLGALWIASGVTHAFRQGDMDKLLATNSCQWCDLRGADLSGGRLSGADLSGTNLSEAKLSGADLSGANLSAVYLRNANLSGANLTGAFLAKSNLRGAQLTDANVAGADFSGCTWIDGTKCDPKSVGKCKQDVTGGPKDNTKTLFPFDF